jgi:hypothetical protein
MGLADHNLGSSNECCHDTGSGRPDVDAPCDRDYCDRRLESDYCVYGDAYVMGNCGRRRIERLLAMTLAYCCGPEPLPPEPDPFIPKQHRVTRESWLQQYVPAVCRSAWKVIASNSSSGRILRGRQCGFRYSSNHLSGSRVRRRQQCRRLAMSLRLVTVTCMATSAMGDTTLFDADSKPIAIDNCSSRCLTNSRSDFLPGSTNRCNVSVIGVGEGYDAS